MKIKKNIITTVAALSLAAFILPSPVVSAAESVVPSMPTATSSGTTISPLADSIEWIYYTAEDGKKYKRLYNFSTREWIGEWIYVSG